MRRIFNVLLAGGVCIATPPGIHCPAAESEAPPPLGKMYEIGGHKMHLYKTGETDKGPSIVLEAGAGAFSIDWYLVQHEVAKFSSVCSYDRAGHAWSEL